MPADTAFQPNTDAKNASRVAARRDWRISRLIEELERDGNEIQVLLSKLTDEDQNLYIRGLSMNLGQFLRVVEQERHDEEHLRQMETTRGL